MANVNRVKAQGNIYDIEDMVARADEKKTGDEISALKRQINQIGGSGQPVAVTLASKMIDTDQIYVYLGEETGYDYGYIYIYLNDAWTKTGLYGRGSDGTDGYSPTATVTSTATGVSISITDKEGTTTADLTNGTATDEQVADWLNAHPEATTTVEDGSITKDKLSAELYTDLQFADRTRLAIPAGTKVEFPGDGFFIQNPLKTGQTGNVGVTLYDANGAAITITRVSDESVVSSGYWRYAYNPSSNLNVIRISGTNLHLYTFVNWKDATVANSLYPPTEYTYSLSAQPAFIKFDKRMTFNAMANFIAQEFDSKISDSVVLNHLIEYLNNNLGISKLFESVPAIMRLTDYNTTATPNLWKRYPIRNGHYFNLPTTSAITVHNVAFYDVDGNLILPSGNGLNVHASGNYATIQERYSFEYKDGRYRVYEWYAHGQIPSYPLPAYNTPMSWTNFENNAIPAYISFEGSFNCVFSSANEANDEMQFIDIKTDSNFGFANQLAEIVQNDTRNGFGDGTDFGRWLKSQFVYQMNRARHALRVSSFNVARYGQKHWYRIKQFYQEHGVDIAGLQEVSAPLGTESMPLIFSEYFNSWQFTNFSTNGDAYPTNERMFMSTADYPIASTQEVYYQTQKIDSSGDHRYYTKCEFRLPRYRDKRGSEYLKLSIYNTQLEVSSHNTRMAQAQELVEAVSADNNPFIIVLGDTNDFDLNKPIWSLFENIGFSTVVDTNTATVSGSTDYNCIDNFFLSPRLSAIDYEIINANNYKFESSSGSNPLSDHDMLYTDVVFNYSDIHCVTARIRYGTVSGDNIDVDEADSSGYVYAHGWVSSTGTLTLTFAPNSGYALSGSISRLDCQIANPDAFTVGDNYITIDGSMLIGDVSIYTACTEVTS